MWPPEEVEAARIRALKKRIKRRIFMHLRMKRRILP
jgi:hypothetical protein